MNKAKEIRELKLERLKLLEENGYDRSNPAVAKREREILERIEELSK